MKGVSAPPSRLAISFIRKYYLQYRVGLSVNMLGPRLFQGAPTGLSDSTEAHHHQGLLTLLEQGTVFTEGHPGS